MPNVTKKELAQCLSERFSRTQNFIIFDHTSLSHKLLESLRKVLLEHSARFSVVKNSLLEVALLKYAQDAKEMDREDGEKLRNTIFIGPSAVLFFGDDWAEGLSAFHTFVKDYDNVGYKLGIIDGDMCTPETLLKLATLPTRTELLAKVVGGMRSSQYLIIADLRYHTSRFVRILSQASKKN